MLLLLCATLPVVASATGTLYSLTYQDTVINTYKVILGNTYITSPSIHADETIAITAYAIQSGDFAASSEAWTALNAHRANPVFIGSFPQNSKPILERKKAYS